MTAITFIKNTNKNLNWNFKINNILFRNKQIDKLQRIENFEFVYNYTLKHMPKLHAVETLKFLIACLELKNNSTWKMLAILTNHIFYCNNQEIKFLNNYTFSIYLKYIKHLENNILYAQNNNTNSVPLNEMYSLPVSLWLNAPSNIHFENLNISSSTDVAFKNLRKFLTRRTHRNTKLAWNQQKLINNSISTIFTENIFQKEEAQDSILHIQYFNQKHLKTPLKTLFLLHKLEAKIENLGQTSPNTENHKSLLQFYNFLKFIIFKKQDNFLSKQILGQIDILSKIKTIAPEIFFEFLRTKYKNTRNIAVNWNVTQSLPPKSENFMLVKARFTPNVRLAASKVFFGKKLEIENRHFKLSNSTKILDLVLNAKVQIFYINALSIAKFGFLLEKQKGNSFLQNLTVSPNKFLNNLDREMISKYKYIGVYIKDLIRVCFIALFLKKPAFLAKFIAFQISVLPKNRRETSFVRFLIKVVKTLAAEREEILGLRLKFKGRVNRWRRTKVILGQRGILPLHTINNRIEYGTAQAVNRKGALGIHIWIWYNPLFKNSLKETYTEYFKYSNNLNTLTKY